jgi:hypothetical protein
MKLFIILIETPFKLLRPLSWVKFIKRKLFRKDYDTVAFSLDVGGDIMIFESKFFGFVKPIHLSNWKKSKYKSRIVQLDDPKDNFKKYL